MPDRPHTGLITYDATDPDTSFPPINPVLPPEGAPNVLIVLLDDVGFGASSVFGGPCQTPSFERLAQTGLKYNRFHTAAMCAPTRTALLTGRNHHSAGMAFRWHGQYHRNGYFGPRLLLGPAQHCCQCRRGTAAERLLHGLLRQMSRSTHLGNQPDRSL